MRRLATASFVCAALALSCKHVDRAASLKDASVSGPVLLVVHGGHYSCGMQRVPSTETLYEPWEGVEGAKLAVASADDPVCSLSADGKRSAAAFASETAGVTPDIATTCASDMALQDDQTRETMRKTPLTMDMFPKLQELARRITATGQTVEWIATCYPLGDDTNDDPPAEGAFTHLYLSQSGNPTMTYETSRKAMWDFLAEKAAQASKVYIIGHSHGGWTAMQDVLKTKIHVAGIATIDPISVPQCNSNNYGINQAIWNAASVQECRQFPGDIDATSRGLVATSADWWLNFHITQGNLHSGTAAEATNKKETQALPGISHGDVDTSKVAWDLIFDRATASGLAH